MSWHGETKLVQKSKVSWTESAGIALALKLDVDDVVWGKRALTYTLVMSISGLNMIVFKTSLSILCYVLFPLF